MSDRPGAGDEEAQRLKERLAALDALHESGDLSAEEHAIARRLAIFGPAGPGSDKKASEPAGSTAPLPKAKSSEVPSSETPTKRRWVISVAAGAGLLVIVGLVLALTLLGGDSATEGTVEAEATQPTVRTWSEPPPLTIEPGSVRYAATMKTSEGTIALRLDARKAPVTVNNFVFLAEQGFYNGLTFHRVIPDFVIQGGDPEGTGTGGPGYQFKDELPRAGEYKVGSVAMANAGPDTNGSQFFIIVGEQGAQLPPAYTLFGQVTKGQGVATRISTMAAPGTETPEPPVVIESITIQTS